MLTIWKQVLQVWPGEKQSVSMPEGSQILSCRIQNEKVCLWFRCLTESKQVEREFVLYRTGFPLDDGTERYITTVQIGADVWHVFEVVQPNG